LFTAEAREVARRFPKTLTFLILATAMVNALPAGAHKKNVAPTLRSAQKRATGILPVKGHGQDGHGTSMNAALRSGATTAGPPASAQKPINQVQVFALLVGQVPSHRVAIW
jgi:hypothetical protein